MAIACLLQSHHPALPLLLRVWTVLRLRAFFLNLDRSLLFGQFLKARRGHWLEGGGGGGEGGVAGEGGHAVQGAEGGEGVPADRPTQQRT